jgi:hypothetical protein
MAVHSFQPAQPLAANCVEMARALKRAQVGKADVIRVTGPAGLTAMIWLCRRGYEQAVFVCGEGIGSRGLADVLLIPHPCRAHELAGLLAAGKAVREGGGLIVQVAAGEAPEAMTAVLEPVGYRLEQRLSDDSRTVLIARRSALGALSRAA